MKRVTIHDVAKLAGVSLGTVSAVINEKNTVKPETRHAVLQAVKQLNYRPWGSTRDTVSKSQRLWTISLIVRELDNPFYTAIALGAMSYAARKGCIVIIASSEGDHTYEERITESFLRKHIKGAIIAPVLEGDAEIEHLFRLRRLNFPFVLLEQVKGINANVVSIDNIKAMRIAVQHLLDLGHRTIVHFAGPQHASHTFERIQGFNRAYADRQLASREDLIVYAGAHVQDGYRTCMQYFSGRERDAFPTAIVCYNDLVAFGVMAALDELGIRVPDDISIVGNDDISFSSRAHVELTTVRAPLFDLGSRAAELLIRNIESPVPLPVENLLLDGELIIRESAREPRSVQTGFVRDNAADGRGNGGGGSLYEPGISN